MRRTPPYLRLDLAIFERKRDVHSPLSLYCNIGPRYIWDYCPGTKTIGLTQRHAHDSSMLIYYYHNLQRSNKYFL